MIEAGINALRSRGAGLSSVRFICGTQDIHKELEEKIARFHGREDAILYASCFDANAGLFEVLLGPEDAVISDQLNHASIIDGIRLCKAQKFRYEHRNMAQLEAFLQQTQPPTARTRLIVTDGVFSMDGNVAPLPDIVELARRYDAIVFIDECHATGFFGATGRGTEEFYRLPTGTIEVINSTLGKALGGAAGGYTTGPKELIELLRQKSRPYLFSNSLPPPVVATASKVFDLLMADSSLVERVTENTKHFRGSMKEAGFNILVSIFWSKKDKCLLSKQMTFLQGDEHPICPVYVGDARLATAMADAIFGEWVAGIINRS